MPPLSHPLSDATVAAYYLHGIEAGLFPFDCAKDWAYGVVAKLDDPPIEIIEIAAANRREEAFSSLEAASQRSDLPMAGAHLLSAISQALESGCVSLRAALRMSMQVAKSTSMPREVYYAFDGLDDELTLAEGGTYGTASDVHGHAREEFLRFGASCNDAI